MINPAVYAVFALLAGILIIRSFYGFCQSDESFYAATAGRFAAGDLVFVDEWHPTQLAALITAPFYLLYTRVTGGTAGILLYFRILYVIFTTAEAVWVYALIKEKKGKIPAFALSVFLMLYCHLNIATLSYYTLCFHFFVLSMTVLYGVNNIAGYILGGVFFALSVLSLPSLAAGYMISMLILLFTCIFLPDLRRPLVCFTAGIGIPLLLFIIYLYASGNSIAGLLANLPNILSDSEHDRGWVESVKVFFRAISDVFGRVYYLSIVMVILAMLSYVNSELKKHIAPYLLLADVLMFIYYFAIGCNNTGFMNTAFALFVFPLFFLTEKKNWFVFLTFFLGGLAVSMTYSLSSFCDLYVLSIGHGISAAGGLLLFWDFLLETGEKAEKRGIKNVWKLLAIIPAVFLAVTLILRILYVYRDDRLTELTARLDKGPAAGLYTSYEHKKQYDSLCGSILKYDTEGRGGVLFTRLLPWGYTAGNSRVLACDTWRHSISDERLIRYYESHALPDVVYVLDAEVASYESSGDVEADPAPNVNELEGTLADRLKAEYDIYNEEYCTVYVRRGQ